MPEGSGSKETLLTVIPKDQDGPKEALLTSVYRFKKQQNPGYQPQTSFLIFLKSSPWRPLVNMSASCSWDVTLTIEILPDSTCCRNQWYFTAINLLVGVILGLVATRRAPALSSKTVHFVSNLSLSSGSPTLNTASFSSALVGNKSRKD